MIPRPDKRVFANILMPTLLVLGPVTIGACTTCMPSKNDVKAHIMAPPPAIKEQAKAAAKLNIIIVVDQMRGDEWLGLSSIYTAGIKRMNDEGRSYLNAMHTHGHTVTGAGHATLGTGVLPKKHGIVDQSFFDRTQNKQRDVCDYVQDSEHPGPKPICDANLLEAPTLADRLLLASPNSQIVAVSQKARSANLLAGQNATLVAWIKQGTTSLVGRQKGNPGLPLWLSRTFAQSLVKSPPNAPWLLPDLPQALIHERASAAIGNRDIGLGKAFPHAPPKKARQKDIAASYLYTPQSDTTIIDLAISAIDNLKLGQGSAPDILYVSLSATDLVGHAFGFESLERAAVLANVDKVVGRLLDHAERQVGPDHVWAALSSDHGVMPKVALSRRHHIESGIIHLREGQRLIDKALAPFSGRVKLTAVSDPFIHLSGSSKVEVSRASHAVAKALNMSPKVYKAWTLDELNRDDSEIARLMRGSSHPKSVGEVIFALKPYFAVGYETFGDLGGFHGSPWPYDRHIPLAVWGKGVQKGHVDTPVAAIDLTQTLAFSLGLAPIADGGTLLP